MHIVDEKQTFIDSKHITIYPPKKVNCVQNIEWVKNRIFTNVL